MFESVIAFSFFKFDLGFFVTGDLCEIDFCFISIGFSHRDNPDPVISIGMGDDNHNIIEQAEREPAFFSVIFEIIRKGDDGSCKDNLGILEVQEMLFEITGVWQVTGKAGIGWPKWRGEMTAGKSGGKASAAMTATNYGDRAMVAMASSEHPERARLAM